MLGKMQYSQCHEHGAGQKKNLSLYKWESN